MHFKIQDTERYYRMKVKYKILNYYPKTHGTISCNIDCRQAIY